MLSCAVVQEWQKLGAEYVASKHYAKSVHRLQLLASSSAASLTKTICNDCLHSPDAVGLSVWHCL